MTKPDAIFKALGLTGEYSEEAIDTIDAELAKLEPKIIAVREKRLDAREKQGVLNDKWNDLVATRGYLHAQRPARPGDVVVG